MTTPHFLARRVSWPGLPWVIGGGFVLRLLVVMLTARSLHSDEIFQYVEQAHRLTYGYGYTPWEYVHGIRNWLLPGALSLVLSGYRWLGLTDPDFYIPAIRILACLCSLSVIYCAYQIGRTVCSESVGRIASLLMAGWYELVIRASSVTPEIFGAYLLMGAAACLVAKPSRKTALLLGLCAAGATALRLQYAPVTVVMGAVALGYTWQKRWSVGQLAIAATGFLTVTAFVGWLDYYTWGSYFVSYTNNYLYNKVYGVSSFWGEQPVWMYLAYLGLYSGGLFWVAIANSLRRKSKPWLLLALLAAVILPHSLIAHKEYRFIFAAAPFGLMLTAQAIDDLWQRRSGSRNWGKVIVRLAVFYSVTVLLVTSFFLDPKTSQLRAYLYLNDQPELVSVLNLYAPWYTTGGYYYLHRDVPIYFPEQLADIEPTDWVRYVSHIVCDPDQAAIPGFTAVTHIGKVDVRTADRPPTETLDIETRYPPQGGVDGVYKPNVTPRF